MKRFAILAVVCALVAPQAMCIALLADDGTMIDNWQENSGEWQSVSGAYVRTATQEKDTTHALLLKDGINFANATFPITVTYDVKVDADNGGTTGEVWSGIGLFAPAAGASNVEDGAVIAALRANNTTKGLHLLVGGRQWISQENNLAWKANTWYTIRLEVSNPNFTTNRADIKASISEKGGVEGATVTLAGAPVSGNAYLLGNKGVAMFSRSSAAGLGGKRYYDNIVVEAAGVPGDRVIYSNDGTNTAGFTPVLGVFEVVNGAIVRTDPVVPDKTQGCMLDGVANLAGSLGLSLEYDIKVESLMTGTNETWSGIGLFTPKSTASNIEDGAIIMAIREGGATGPKGLHALLGGRAWLDNKSNNLKWKADTWYHMSVTVTNANLATGKANVAATLSEIGGFCSASQVLINAPSTNKFELKQTGIALFSRSGSTGEGGKRSYDNIKITTFGSSGGVNSFVPGFDIYK